MKTTCAALILTSLFAIRANAIQFTLNYEFTGGVTPSGPLVVTLTDAGGGGVDAAFDLTGLSSTEFVTEWYLNLALGDLSGVGFSVISKVGSFDDPSFSKGIDGFSPSVGTAGNFDLLLSFATSGSDSGAHRFGAGEILNAHFSGVTAADFVALSTGGTEGAFHSAAHVQGIPPTGGSGKVGDVPDGGATIILLGAGLAALGLLKRRAKI
jgi:hypothetical protein